jgi:hypothetical protein
MQLTASERASRPLLPTRRPTGSRARRAPAVADLVLVMLHKRSPK